MEWIFIAIFFLGTGMNQSIPFEFETQAACEKARIQYIKLYKPDLTTICGKNMIFKAQP